MVTRPEVQDRRARILLVDDHPIVLRGLSVLVNQESDLTVCGEAADAHNALTAIEVLKPDLVIVDISLKGTNGLELIKSAKALHAELPMLVLSIHSESLYAERALRAGAMGYIMKEEMTEKLILAIRRVLKGEIYLSEKMSTNLLSQIIKHPLKENYLLEESLTDRELEIFQLIGRGDGTRQIAEALHLSMKTVESHREHIKEKLKLRNATELLQRAFQWVQRLGFN